MGIMVAIFGLMMNLYVIGSCMFQRIKKINTITGDPIPGSERGFGFLGRETDYGITPDYRQCSWYTAEEYDILFDGWMHTGRIFAFLSAIIATIGFVVLFLTCCMAFSPSMFEKWLFWMYIVAAITVAFSFFIFGSEYCADNDCKVADGCGWAISAFMFHLVAANTVKSFAAPNAPASKRSPKKAANNDDDEYDDDEDDDNEDLDDLHYENESDKYPAPHPDGPRGVVADKDGIKEYDDGEDYYNEMGRLISGDEQGDYKRTRKADNDDEDLDDISDHDLENYASDDEDDENGKATKKKQYDQNGNPIFDPDAIDQTGNLGVGYQGDDGTSREAYDEHGNRLRRFDDNGHPIYNGDVDEYGNPVPRHHHHQNVDDFGNPVQSHFVDEFGNPVVSQQQQQYDDFGHQELDEYGNHMYSDNDGQHQNNYTTLDSSRGTVQNNGASDPFVEAGNDTGTRQGNGQQQYNRRDNDDDDDEGPVFT